MTQPKVTITELDGALGVLSSTSGRLLAIVGVASSGPLNTPATFARIKDVVSNFGAGPLVEAAAYYIERFQRPVLIVRADASVAGEEGTLDVSDWTGTAAPTLDVMEPNDDYEAQLVVINGGTIAADGITVQWSLDGGRTMSKTTALGTDDFFEFPGTGGLRVEFAAGNVVAGDTLSTRTKAPNWNASDLTAAIEALRLTSVSWELLHVVGPTDGDSFDAVELKMAALSGSGKHCAWIGNTRMPNGGESEAAYLIAMDTLLASKRSTRGVVCSGGIKITSSISGRKYRRPWSFYYASVEGSVSEEVNTADVNLGAAVGVSIRDANGNPDEHDESANPGLDDARFCVARTWEGRAGVYVNRPRLFSGPDSDFQLLPHRRVMNLAHYALQDYFVRRLNRPVLVDKNTGFILESEAQEIESGANAVLEAALLAKPKASGTSFTLSRTDNLLSTKTMTGQARVIPLAYPEFINLDLGFLNPALRVVTV